MTLYLDSSALLKRYVDEPDSEVAERYLLADPDWATARHTEVELRRNLPRLLSGESLLQARLSFQRDWENLDVVELDAMTCSLAATAAELTGARTLDALHLAAAQRLGLGGLTFLTFDLRQAQAARRLGLRVAGV